VLRKNIQLLKRIRKTEPVLGRIMTVTRQDKVVGGGGIPLNDVAPPFIYFYAMENPGQ
jgi:hypothetical protein